MTIAYWILAALLAVFYLYAGGKKVTQSRDRLRSMMAWVDDIPLRLTRTIGVLEVLGAAGLILPPLLGVLPWLALVAAIGFVALQLAAGALHLSRGERHEIGLNIALFALASVTVWLATVWL
jgi:hypothetical protein